MKEQIATMNETNGSQDPGTLKEAIITLCAFGSGASCYISMANGFSWYFYKNPTSAGAAVTWIAASALLLLGTILLFLLAFSPEKQAQE